MGKSGPFEGRVEVTRPLRDLLILAAMIALSACMRVLDVISLLRSPFLLRPYFSLIVSSWVRSPFSEGGFSRTHLARRANQSLGEFVYGETPVVTATRLFRRGGVDKRSTVIDLGAGRGRVLLAARHLGATAIGVELLPEHIDAVRDAMASAGATMVRGDAAFAPLHDATHVFVTWTCLSESTRARVLENLVTTTPQTLVYTVTFPVEHPAFETIAHLRPFFSWGRADVYISRRLSHDAAVIG